MLLLASWQLSASTQAATFTFESGSGRCLISSSIDGIDCITFENITSDNVIASDNCASENEKKQPGQDRNDPSDSTGDLDDSDVGLDDLTADNSSRNDQETPYLPATGLDPVTLRAPAIIPIPLLTVHCFYGLHDHIRERAPPSRRSPRLAAAAAQTLS